MKVSTLKEIISGLEDTDDICCDIYTYEWAEFFGEYKLSKEAWSIICDEYDSCQNTPDPEWMSDAITEKLEIVTGEEVEVG